MSYNGWKNYATWRINLEYFDDNQDKYYESIDYNRSPVALSEILEDDLKSYLEECAEGLALDYALAFVDQVDFFEIAEHFIDEYNDQHCSNCNEWTDDDMCSTCKEEYENSFLQDKS